MLARQEWQLRKLSGIVVSALAEEYRYGVYQNFHADLALNGQTIGTGPGLSILNPAVNLNVFNFKVIKMGL